jgi:hypothetical protein
MPFACRSTKTDLPAERPETLPMMEYTDFVHSCFSEVFATLSNQRKRIRKERETSFKGCSEMQFQSNATVSVKCRAGTTPSCPSVGCSSIFDSYKMESMYFLECTLYCWVTDAVGNIHPNIPYDFVIFFPTHVKEVPTKEVLIENDVTYFTSYSGHYFQFTFETFREKGARLRFCKKVSHKRKTKKHTQRTHFWFSAFAFKESNIPRQGILKNVLQFPKCTFQQST